MARNVLLFLQCASLALRTATAAGSTPTFTADQLNHEVVTFDYGAVVAAAVTLPHDLIGMSLEFCYITSYLGDVNAPNAFSTKLLQNIQDRTGSPPRIRLGGDTQDSASYCEACPQTLNATFVNGSTEAAATSFNKNLFTVLNENVPSNQIYTLGLNLGSNEYSIPQAELTATQTYMNLSRIEAYELGNEPDFYSNHSGHRPSNWTVVDYLTQTASWLVQLFASLGKRNNKSRGFPGWMYGSTANPPTTATDFNLVTMIKLGIQNVVKNINIFSVHVYFGDVCTPADAAKVDLPVLMNHINTVEVTSTYVPAIAAARSTGAKFYMGEGNSAACHGKSGVSDTLGAALWMLDFSLYSATIGFDALHFHNGIGFFYSMWQPLELNGTKPTAYGLYYGLLFFADLVSDLRHDALVSNIASLDNYDLVHYGIFGRSGKLQKLVILNLDYINSTSTRTYKTFDVSSTLGEKVKVTRLTAPNADANTGLTVAGQTVDGSGNLSGALNVESVTNGIVSVGSSEAVIISNI